MLGRHSFAWRQQPYLQWPVLPTGQATGLQSTVGGLRRGILKLRRSTEWRVKVNFFGAKFNVRFLPVSGSVLSQYYCLATARHSDMARRQSAGLDSERQGDSGTQQWISDAQRRILASPSQVAWLGRLVMFTGRPNFNSSLQVLRKARKRAV